MWNTQSWPLWQVHAARPHFWGDRLYCEGLHGNWERWRDFLFQRANIEVEYLPLRERPVMGARDENGSWSGILGYVRTWERRLWRVLRKENQCSSMSVASIISIQRDEIDTCAIDFTPTPERAANFVFTPPFALTLQALTVSCECVIELHFPTDTLQRLQSRLLYSTYCRRSSPCSNWIYGAPLRCLSFPQH